MTPRLNAKRFEQLIIDQIREHILTESNMQDLVRLVNEEMAAVVKEQSERVEAAEEELADIRRRMDRLWHLVESTDLTVEEVLPRIRHHLENQERLERAADEARTVLSLRRASVQDVERVAAYAKEMSEFLMESELTETKAFIRSFVKEVAVSPGTATIHYTIPTPEDGSIGGADIAEIALSQVMSSVTRGGEGETRTPTPLGHMILNHARLPFRHFPAGPIVPQTATTADAFGGALDAGARVAEPAAPQAAPPRTQPHRSQPPELRGRARSAT